MLKKILLLIATLLLSSALNASSGEVDKLVGTYSANYYGEQTDRYRIEKHNNTFWIFENELSTIGSKWKRAHKNQKVDSIDKNKFENMMQTKVNKPTFGLNFANRILIFKTTKGFTIGRFTTSTGYFVFFDGIFLELKKEQ